MGNEPPNGNGVSKGTQSLLGFIVAAILLWAGATLIEQGKLSSKNEVRIEFLESKASEIVPRAENERRYQALEDRMHRLEAVVDMTTFGIGKHANSEVVK